MEILSFLCFYVVWNVLMVTGQLFVPVAVELDVSQHNFSVCSMNAYELITSTIKVNMKDSRTTAKVRFVDSIHFGSMVERKIDCNENQIGVSLSHRSFIMLTNGDLHHVYGNIIFPSTEFCFKPILYYDDHENFHIEVEATVCIDVPTAPFCCQVNEKIVRYPDGSNACVPASEPASEPAPLQRSLSVKFDNLTREWNVNEFVTGLPICYGDTILAEFVLYGHLRLISNYLQFRSEIPITDIPRAGNVAKLDPSEYCIGQYDVGSSTRTVGAYCEGHEKDLCKKVKCYAKCCDDEQLYNRDWRTCASGHFDEAFSIPTDDDDFSVTNGRPLCMSSLIVNETYFADDTFIFIRESNSIYHPRLNFTWPIHEYCFETLANDAAGVVWAAVLCLDAEIKKAFNIG